MKWEPGIILILLILILPLTIAGRADPIRIQDSQQKQQKPVYPPQDAAQWPVWNGEPIPPGQALVVIGGTVRIAPSAAGQVSCDCEQPQDALILTRRRSLSPLWWILPAIPMLALIPRSTDHSTSLRPAPSGSPLPLPSPTPATAVPEPISLGLLITGLTLIGACRKSIRAD